ncbi:acyl-CoA dehydrogenase [Amycolatopsis antarctica]|uniref:Acyl-CoA dehydrogenase n=1 Tax=Amycolatopsis antarctica TaxID=1854586 RepID=A0A263D1C4_9PSEU|nr:acyl-CoA dehydrogenase family protein [Amycolatopsis antarctica]OZM72284.1 acyl-CoA dehydrogenase [Amycolatopsis antarctica]
MTDTVPTASTGDPTATPQFADMLAQVTRRREEFTAKRHVPRDMVDEFVRLGFYRAATPARFGGDALPPARFLRMVERVSEADGSAGWVASFGSASVYLAALPVRTQERIYAGGPDVVFAGGLFPVQAATPVEGGYRVDGRWKFASGAMAADLLGVGIGDGAGGRPRTAVLPPADVEIAENWDVVGLEGTGSHDLVVRDVVVPEEWTFVRGGAPSVDEPLYRYPSVAYAAQVLAVVNLGIARAALDHAIRVGGGYAGITGAPKLADRAYYRIAVAKAEAELRSARAFFYEITEEVYATVEGGDPATAVQTGMLRMAAAHAAKVGFDVVRSAYGLSGTTAIHSGHPMQRLLRDAAVVPQHAFLTEGMYDGAGSVLMGVPAFPGFV